MCFLLKAGRYLIGLVSIPLSLFWELALNLGAIPLVLILVLFLSSFTPLKFWIRVLISLVATILLLFAAPGILPTLTRYRWRLFTKEVNICALQGTTPGEPFILYLRPFDADFSSATQPPYEGQSEADLIGYADDGSPLIHGFFTRTRPVHLERYIRVALLPRGRMLALANPAESQIKSPYRLVTENASWRDMIEHLCRDAELVVCVAPLDEFDAPDTRYEWIPLQHRKPAFSRDRSYAGFYEELRYLAVDGHCDKVLLVIPGWQNTQNKWAALKVKLANAGFSLPEKPEISETGIASGLGLFQFHRSGEYRFHYWIQEIPEQAEWSAMVWLTTARLFAYFLGKKMLMSGAIIGMSEYRWLLGPSTADILRATWRMTDRKT